MVFIYYEIKCLLDEMRILDKSFLEPKQARQQPFRIILHTAYLLNRGFFFVGGGCFVVYEICSIFVL